MAEVQKIASIITSCCLYRYVAVLPTIRLAELECPKCGEMQVPKNIFYIEDLNEQRDTN